MDGPGKTEHTAKMIIIYQSTASQKIVLSLKDAKQVMAESLHQFVGLVAAVLIDTVNMTVHIIRLL